MLNTKTLTWDDVYPVGSIYMSVNAVNPSNLFGGEWEQIQNRFLLAAGTNYNNGTTGGSATHTPSGTLSGGAVGNHTLTVAETPAHTHTRGTMNITGGLSGVDGAGNMAYTWGFKAKTDGAFTVAQTGVTYNKFGGAYSVNYGANAVFNAANSWTGETSSVGNGGAHNHPFTQPIFTGTAQNTMPPYLAVYIWKRIV